MAGGCDRCGHTLERVLRFSLASGSVRVAAWSAEVRNRLSMDQSTHNKIVSFIWGIAADVRRDLFKRGKYPDVILPMCVTRRMDAVLEPTEKKALLARNAPRSRTTPSTRKSSTSCSPAILTERAGRVPEQRPSNPGR